MKTIVKNRSRFNFLKGSIENLERAEKPLPNREVLLMYREVMKMTQRFTWNNEDGEPWKDILQKTARQEFEGLREETDSVKVGKFLLTWRESVQRIHEKINKA